MLHQKPCQVDVGANFQPVSKLLTDNAKLATNFDEGSHSNIDLLVKKFRLNSCQWWLQFDLVGVSGADLNPDASLPSSNHWEAVGGSIVG